MLHSPALRFLSSDTSGGKDVEHTKETKTADQKAKDDQEVKDQQAKEKETLKQKAERTLKHMRKSL